MQLSFRLDKRPGESHLALDGKKIVSPVDMAGLIGMAQTLAVFHFGYHTLKRREVHFTALLKSQLMLQQCLTGDLILPLCHKTGRHWQLP